MVFPHFLYVDDDINDIRMPFELDKCGWMVSKRGKMIKTEGTELPEGHIADVQDSYKCLRIPEMDGWMDGWMDKSE